MTDLDKLLDMEYHHHIGVLNDTSEYESLKSKLEEKLDNHDEATITLWKRSYDESERCLIQRGKEINSLKDELQQVQYDKAVHTECARNAAYFAEKAYKLEGVIDKIRVKLNEYQKTPQYTNKILHCIDELKEILKGVKK